MNSNVLLFFLFVSAFAVLKAVGEDCKKPDELKLKEDFCWTAEVEIVDRVVQTSKSVLNFAKKKLGITTEEETEIKKCNYYQCILRHLHLLNANDYPSYENIKNWAEKNVIYFQELEFVKTLDHCQSALTNSTVEETYFFGDQMGDASISGEQTKCDIASEFIKCLSLQEKCPVFQFP